MIVALINKKIDEMLDRIVEFVYANFFEVLFDLFFDCNELDFDVVDDVVVVDDDN
jgi:hypothetical protein